MKIMIGLLGEGKEHKEKEGGLLEPEMECPLALQDKTVNKGNKRKAILKAEYGEAIDKRMSCGTCEYFDQGDDMVACGLEEGSGFCKIWEFSCAPENTCLAWETVEELGEEDASEE